jgi:hypothetical protein
VTAGVLAFAVTAAAGYALVALRPSVQEDPVQGNGAVATPWFEATLPSGWHAVVDSHAEFGEGVVAAQFSTFQTPSLVCTTESTEPIPADGAVLRLTIGSELPVEGNLVRPTLESVIPLAEPPGEFVNDCSANQLLFAMFYGPDGQLMTAHYLAGENAPQGAQAAAERVLDTLRPTGEKPTKEPHVKTKFVEGTDVGVGPWIMATDEESPGIRTLVFETTDTHLGIAFAPNTDGIEVAIGGEGSSGLVVAGVAPASTATVQLVVQGGKPLEGVVVPLPADDGSQVAFWVGPVEGELRNEGQTLSPPMRIVAKDETGTPIASRPLP